MHTLQNILLVGIGGFTGSVLRYLVSLGCANLLKTSTFPLGTATVNIVGCLIIGVLGGVSDHSQIISSNIRLLLMVGLLGGFTTFSSFNYETMQLIRNQEIYLAFFNVFIQLLLGFGAVLLGYYCSKLIYS